MASKDVAFIERKQEESSQSAISDVNTSDVDDLQSDDDDIDVDWLAELEKKKLTNKKEVVADTRRSLQNASQIDDRRITRSCLNASSKTELPKNQSQNVAAKISQKRTSSQSCLAKVPKKAEPQKKGARSSSKTDLPKNESKNVAAKISPKTTSSRSCLAKVPKKAEPQKTVAFKPR